jgi:hypothetical protein
MENLISPNPVLIDFALEQDRTYKTQFLDIAHSTSGDLFLRQSSAQSACIMLLHGRNLKVHP